MWLEVASVGDHCDRCGQSQDRDAVGTPLRSTATSPQADVPQGRTGLKITMLLLPGASVGGMVALTAVGEATPWTIAIICVPTSVVAVVQAVFPQESEHRCAWWRDRRRYLTERRKARAAGAQRSRVGVG
jgi:hypothetical protein